MPLTLLKKLHLHPALALMLLFVPISLVAEMLHAPGIAVFVLAALAIIPLAGVMGKATEELAMHAGPTVGGLLNATLGNMAELIIAVIAIREGLFDVVKASLTGSIVGNILLVLGLSMLVGGCRHKSQEFNPKAAGMNSLMLVLACIGLLLPALVEHTVTDFVLEEISLIVAGVLILVYAAGLVFSFVTHSHLFSPGGRSGEAEEEPGMGVRLAVGMLIVATVFMALESEALVGSVEAAAHALGMRDLFIGVFVVAIIGNAAEHSSAITMALKNKMELSFGIAINSSTQVALFAAPALVFISLAMGNPMNLVFTQMEILAVILSVLVVYMASLDGRCDWFEGFQLLAVYIVMAVVFYFIP